MGVTLSTLYIYFLDTMWLLKAVGTNSKGVAAATVQIQTEGYQVQDQANTQGTHTVHEDTPEQVSLH